jgi:hypothetical protein
MAKIKLKIEKNMKPAGKKVKGQDYVGADEEFDKKRIKKQGKEMRTAGIAKELKGAEKEQGYSKMPRVKGQKKDQKIVAGKKKAY